MDLLEKITANSDHIVAKTLMADPVWPHFQKGNKRRRVHALIGLGIRYELTKEVTEFMKL